VQVISCITPKWGEGAKLGGAIFEGSVSVLEHLNCIKDLGVNFDLEWKFNLHIDEKVHTAYSVLGLIYRNVKYLSTNTLVMFYKKLVRSHLEYANCVWSPFREMDVEKVEKVQMRATRMVEQLKNHSYEDKLKVLNLPTLKYRHLRGDMIQVYNIISGVHDSYSSLQFIMSNVFISRGNQYKIQLTHIYCNLRKHFFY